MLTEVCNYLKNWFNERQPIYYGDFIIENGVIRAVNNTDMGIQEGQYFRICDSVFNDGVHTLADVLKDESFNGSVWLMAVPQDVIDLDLEISAWQAKYGGIDSVNLSPFNSESFGGYSYSKGAGGASSSGSSIPTWQSMYASRLMRYKKI